MAKHTSSTSNFFLSLCMMRTPLTSRAQLSYMRCCFFWTHQNMSKNNTYMTERTWYCRRFSKSQYIE